MSDDNPSGQRQATIRQAILEDASAIAEFNINMARETENLELDAEVINSGVRNMISNPERGFYLVVEADNQLVASLMVTTEWSDWRNGLFWWIQSVYVVEQWRRKGLYRSMYERVKQLSEEHGNIVGYRLYVEQDNQIAQKTYRSMGMHCTHYLLFEEMKSS
ncbi:MAG: GNAT family N-acetyltransferase [Gammaproteobacteria bacterium]|nr:GNAT family N-acetyltransferase [Gammaproteobacteria bacterium]